MPLIPPASASEPSPPPADAASAVPDQVPGYPFNPDGSTFGTGRRMRRWLKESRERAALIRKLGACGECRRRRIACHPSHHGMTFEDVVGKFHIIQDVAPSLGTREPINPISDTENIQPVSAQYYLPTNIGNDSNYIDSDERTDAYYSHIPIDVSDSQAAEARISDDKADNYDFRPTETQLRAESPVSKRARHKSPTPTKGVLEVCVNSNPTTAPRDSGETITSVDSLATETLASTMSNSSRQVSESTGEFHKERTFVGPGQLARQVGIARIHIDVTSYVRASHVRQLSNEATESSDDDFEYDQSLNDEEGPRPESTSESSSANEPPCPNGSEGSSSQSNAPCTNLRRDANGDEDARDNGETNKHPRRKPHSAGRKKRAGRFACPYQAFESSQNCFKPGPRNPDGGCDGIYRLKQHLIRRHMRSYRCSRCWRSFDTRRKLISHGTLSEPCEPKSIPRDDRFMNPEHELELDRLSLSGCEEEAWWRLFQLLIPGMQDRDLQQLKIQYWPYFIQFDALMIPAISFSNTESPQVATEEELRSTMSNEPSHSSIHIPPATGSPVSFSGASHTFSVPLLETYGGYQSNDSMVPASLFTSHATQSPISHFASNMQPDRPVIPTETSAASSDGQHQSVSDQTQLRQAYERLKSRISATQREYNRLREANCSALSMLGQADEILDDLLTLTGLPSEASGMINELSNILSNVQAKLR